MRDCPSLVTRVDPASTALLAAAVLGNEAIRHFAGSEFIPCRGEALFVDVQSTLTDADAQ